MTNDVAKRLRVNEHGARLNVFKREVRHERINVSVKDQADNFAFFVNRRTAGVAADNIVGRNEVKERFFRRPIFRFRVTPRLR